LGCERKKTTYLQNGVSEMGNFASRPFKPWLLLALVLLGTLALTACGDVPASATTVDSQADLGSEGPQQARYEVMEVNSKPQRTVTGGPVSQTDALAALQTWDSQSLGVSPTLAEAKGLNRQVLATYEILNEQYGTITANIAASRAAYGAKIQGGGYNILLLGGGSTLSNQSLSVQIQSASLGYLQLPAQTFPTSSDAALAQLKQAFPALSSYNFTSVNSPNGNQYSYSFYSSQKNTVRNQVVPAGILTGVVRFKDKIWIYVTIGTGNFKVIP
jgi:hypothetical protein